METSGQTGVAVGRPRHSGGQTGVAVGRPRHSGESAAGRGSPDRAPRPTEGLLILWRPPVKRVSRSGDHDTAEVKRVSRSGDHDTAENRLLGAGLLTAPLGRPKVSSSYGDLRSNGCRGRETTTQRRSSGCRGRETTTQRRSNGCRGRETTTQRRSSGCHGQKTAIQRR